MSTRSTDVEKEQSASQGPPGTIFNEDTLQMGTASPPPTAPQPPKHTDHSRRNFWLAIAAVVIVLALVFSVFAIFIAQPGKQTGSQPAPGTTPGTTVPTTPGTDTTPTPSPGVTHGPQNGPPPVNTTAYWDTILGTKGTNSKVESVSFANVMGNPSLQALVTVRHNDAYQTLDAYVFNNITSKNPTQIFKLTGLMKGETRISYYNSIMTAEVNPNSALNAGTSVAQMTPDIYREFAWINRTMTQVAFPGIFPVMTRYQAEADQAMVNAGHDPWKNDAAAVAKALEAKFMNWQRTVTTKVLKGGGPNDVSATVQVQEAPIQNAHPTIVVTLSRLEGNTHNIWVVTGVTDSSTLTLKNIAARQSISSPVTLTGTGSAFESQIGQAVVYDQAYANIGHATVHGSTAFGQGTYSTKVSYTSSFPGVQEGMVTVYQDMGGLSAENETAVMVKVLVNPTPGTSIMDPAYWTQFVSTPSATRIAEGLRFGPLLKNGSWQAVVVARDIQGGPVYRDVFVFDKITDPHPQLVWHESRLLHGDAKVSGYPSLMTSQVDANSSINTGKPEKAWTNDLFREFLWSSTSGTFEQVVFPGMFPDLTRWQAEESQNAVFDGKDAWRLDPVQTTQHWSLIAGTAKLVSGSGSFDITAEVDVTYPDKGGPTTNIPITKVMLSRLNGAVNGVWEITSVSTDWLFIYTPTGLETINSPVTVTGYGPQYEAVIGAVHIRDRLYNEIQVGNNFAMAPDGSSPPSKFSLDVKYTSTITGITQEGIVQLSHSSGPSFARGTVMVKVLINPASSTPIQDPAYWTQFVSAPPAIRVADSVSFGHLLGNNSLQAVVVARDILGGGPVYRDVFVFDNINASQPKLLWHESRLLHGDAKISGYNTVMTSQVDVNSSINTGKPEGAWTNDLFREFQWSVGARTFVQTAFPGFFPDLTRWQAEAAQAQVNAGQNAWRNDPIAVAKSAAAQLMNWQGTLTAKVLSGGGPSDVSATIQAQSTPIQSAQPTIIVTLSRLEGNTHNIWEVIGVKDGTTLTLKNITARQTISSPVMLTGTGSAFEAVIGQGVVYDHLFTNIGHAQLTGSPGMGIANYSIRVPYSSSFKGGAQEGIVAVYQDMGGLSNEYSSAVMVKVLIGG